MDRGRGEDTLSVVRQAYLRAEKGGGRGFLLGLIQTVESGISFQWLGEREGGRFPSDEWICISPGNVSGKGSGRGNIGVSRPT